MECDLTRVCALLVGLGDVEALTPKATINLTGQCTSEPSPPVLPPHSQTRMAQAPLAMPALGVCGGLVQ